jgi:hypothetical protein
LRWWRQGWRWRKRRWRRQRRRRRKRWRWRQRRRWRKRWRRKLSCRRLSGLLHRVDEEAAFAASLEGSAGDKRRNPHEHRDDQGAPQTPHTGNLTQGAKFEPNPGDTDVTGFSRPAAQTGPCRSLRPIVPSYNRRGRRAWGHLRQPQGLPHVGARGHGGTGRLRRPADLPAERVVRRRAARAARGAGGRRDRPRYGGGRPRLRDLHGADDVHTSLPGLLRDRPVHAGVPPHGRDEDPRARARDDPHAAPPPTTDRRVRRPRRLDRLLVHAAPVRPAPGPRAGHRTSLWRGCHDRRAHLHAPGRPACTFEIRLSGSDSA